MFGVLKAFTTDVQLKLASLKVDNEVLVKKADGFVRLGDFAQVTITSADHYDLYGVLAQ